MLTSVTSGLSTVIGWVGTVLADILDSTDGEMSSLLPLFAIGISISVVFLAVKVIKRVVWGA